MFTQQNASIKNALDIGECIYLLVEIILHWVICLFVTTELTKDTKAMKMKDKEEMFGQSWHQQPKNEDLALLDSLRVSLLSLEVWHVSD